MLVIERETPHENPSQGVPPMSQLGTGLSRLGVPVRVVVLGRVHRQDLGVLMVVSTGECVCCLLLLLWLVLWVFLLLSLWLSLLLSLWLSLWLSFLVRPGMD